MDWVLAKILLNRKIELIKPFGCSIACSFVPSILAKIQRTLIRVVSVGGSHGSFVIWDEVELSTFSTCQATSAI